MSACVCAVTSFISSELFRGLCLLAGVVVAITSVMTARSVARKKQTADALFASRTDEKLQLGVDCLLDLPDDESKRALAPRNAENKVKRDLLMYVLNYYEFLAVGAKNDIYDERMLRDAQRTHVIRVYDMAKPFIEAVRVDARISSAWQELGQLTERWKDT